MSQYLELLIASVQNGAAKAADSSTSGNNFGPLDSACGPSDPGLL
jgi:hypothetical protein